MAFDFEEYEEPQLGEVSRFEVRSNPNHKILIKINGYQERFQGSFSKEPGPAVFVHVADFSAKDEETGKVPRKYPNVAWQGGSLVDGLKVLLDKKGAGAVTAVVTGKKLGKNGYYYGTLSPMPEESRSKIKAWVDKNGDPFDGMEVASQSTVEAKQSEIVGGLDDFDDAPAGGSAETSTDDEF